MDRKARIEEARKKVLAKLSSDPGNLKYQRKLVEYDAALLNIDIHGHPNGHRPKPHPGDVNINL